MKLTQIHLTKIIDRFVSPEDHFEIEKVTSLSLKITEDTYKAIRSTEIRCDETGNHQGYDRFSFEILPINKFEVRVISGNNYYIL